jgi:predicted O-methyltransferase YrrM
MQTNKSIKGWFWEHEGQLYQKLVSQITNGNVLEIGTFHGLSLSYIVETCILNNTNIYCLDIKKQSELMENLKKWRNPDNVHLKFADSRQAHVDYEDQFFDLIFIDGDHSYETVKSDIANFWPKLKNNGVMCGHDYNSVWPGVMRAVDEAFKERKVVGRIWIVKKQVQITFL